MDYQITLTPRRLILWGLFWPLVVALCAVFLCWILKPEWHRGGVFVKSTGLIGLVGLPVLSRGMYHEMPSIWLDESRRAIALAISLAAYVILIFAAWAFFLNATYTCWV